MKSKLTLLSILLLTVSCGKTVHNHTVKNFRENEVKLLEETNTELLEKIKQLENSIYNIDIRLTENEDQQEELEEQVTANLIRIVELEGKNVVEVIDPCGNNVGQFDEVILRLDDGTLLAYFEQGSNRFLSVLPDGSYRTTDSQRCNFSVLYGTVSW